MKADKTNFFQSIRENSLNRWNQLEDDPELAAPWWQLFKQVQSPRHVLSELLQNADDAGASWAKATIENDIFSFEHNGADFEEEHLASLCKFGKSNKRQLHTIGFRGIGFKSTFSLGDLVNVNTPSLSFYFEEKRFTQPEWNNYGVETENIITSVEIADENRKLALLENLKDWVSNPGAVLFFHNIKVLIIDDYEIRSEKVGDGPVENSAWYDLYTVDKKYNVLLVRSKPERFSQEAIDEVRKERMDDTVELPPASVDIVLGLPGEQKIYTVLPTDVKTKLPFSCNGPFIQDPARTGLKDPSLSPVNRWLLAECGKLASKTMQGWLKNDAYDIKAKSRAYRLLPPYEIEIKSISDKVTDQVSREFGNAINSQSIFLSSDGSVKYGKEIYSIPKEMYTVWSNNDLIYLFGSNRKYILSSVVSDSHINLLNKWDDSFDKKDREDIQFYLINTTHVPKPDSLDGLLSLWNFFDDDITKKWFSWEWKKIKIVPVEGKNYLTSAEKIIRLAHDIDAVCVGRVLDGFVDIIDSKWIKVLSESLDRAHGQANIDNKLLERIEQANLVLHKFKLNQATPFSEIVAEVTDKLNRKHSSDLKLLVTVAKLFARLDVNVGVDFPYVCTDGKVRKIKDQILYKPTAKSLKLIPPEWLNSHELSSLYDENDFDCCNDQEWQKWAFSEKAGLRRFIRPEFHERIFYSLKRLREFYLNSGLSDIPVKKISTDHYYINDYDFNDDVWALWKKLSLTEPEIWSSAILELIRDSGEIAAEQISPQVFQLGKKKSHLMDNLQGLATTWVVKMRELPCLLDTYSIPRKPADLLMRTSETEPLHGIEPFVHQDYDLKKATTLLTLLGVNNTPPGFDSLLARLRAAPMYDELPITDIVSWYRGIDSIVAKYSEAELNQSCLIDIFRSESLILSENQKWCKSDDIFLEKDDATQEEPIINVIVRNLPLWVRVGVERRLTIEHIITKLRSLEFGSMLSSNMLNIVSRWICRNPGRVLSEVKGWVSLKGSWESTHDFKWYLSNKDKKVYSGLFPEFKRSIADFSMIHQDHFDSGGLNLTELSKHLIYQIRNVIATTSPERVGWINTIGEYLERIVSDNHDLKIIARRMKSTRIQMVKTIDLAPYLDNVPAGVVTHPDFYWNDELLYVTKKIAPKNAEQIDKELTKSFEDPELMNAVRMCIMRNEEFIIEYFEANFDLTPELEEYQDDGSHSSESDIVNIQPEKESEVKENNEGDDISPEKINELENTYPDEIEIISSDVAGTDDIELYVHSDDVNKLERDVDDVTFDLDQEETIESEKNKETITKSKIFDSYLQSHGYRLQPNTDCYKHQADGTRICKSEDIFSYEKLDVSGEIVSFYYIATSNFEKGITVAPEVYNYLTKNPKNVNFLVYFDGNIKEIKGEEIKSNVESGEISVYPKAYLLRSNEEA